jgi:cytochrome c5
MYKGLLHTHYLVVILFLLLYTIKTILLLGNKQDLLTSFSRKTRIFEMIISVLFLLTGILMALRLPFGSKYDYLFWLKISCVLLSIPLAVIGFKKSNKILAATSLFLLMASFGLAETYAKKKVVVSGGEEITATDGKGIYDARCSMCHGQDGKLGMAGASDLSVSALNKEDLLKIILNGKGSMPPSGLSKEEAEKVAEYVLTLRR